jgi:REP element-mobilizing transposase RayT
MNRPWQRSTFSHYLPRLTREFYTGDAVVFWTLPVEQRRAGWLSELFHLRFREVMLHAAAREGLLCPAYCLMPDHVHLVWMGTRIESDQRNGMTFLRSRVAPCLLPARWQHQAHDHVLSESERSRSAFAVACTEYVLQNAFKAKLVDDPSRWEFAGAMIPGYPGANPFRKEYWPWFWDRYASARQPGIERRTLPPRRME